MSIHKLSSLAELQEHKFYTYREAPWYGHGHLREGDIVMFLGFNDQGAAVFISQPGDGRHLEIAGPFTVSHPESLETR